ncbi:hypothetical protein H4W32_001861 [Actinophytocola algeriensis]|uniref:Uncharacterized protein n=1 Tax=Actinophytocola algeriensis TaxID=1768010 RepID=A0A7W7QCY9_9PSEU|nr:hypothetical protein [Actinophytocola algeriensis]MBE1473819.1 hypothetical protein [Actinophytocola algeriensis]
MHTTIWKEVDAPLLAKVRRSLTAGRTGNRR